MRIDVTQKLRAAVQEGNLSVVKDCLLDDKVDLPNTDPQNGWTSLHYAVRHNDFEMVSFLLERRHERYGISADNEGKTPLMIAAIHRGNTQIAKVLVQMFPSSIQMTSQEGWTALLYAARHGNEEIIGVLLDHGADIDSLDEDGSTPLHKAAAWGHYKAVKLLIERGCKTAVKNHAGWTPLDYSYSTKLKSFLEECARSAFEDSRTKRRRNNTVAGTGESSLFKESSRTRSPSSPLPPGSCTYVRSTSLSARQRSNSRGSLSSDNDKRNSVDTLSAKSLPPSPHPQSPTPALRFEVKSVIVDPGTEPKSRPVSPLRTVFESPDGMGDEPSVLSSSIFKRQNNPQGLSANAIATSLHSGDALDVVNSYFADEVSDIYPLPVAVSASSSRELSPRQRPLSIDERTRLHRPDSTTSNIFPL